MKIFFYAIICCTITCLYPKSAFPQINIEQYRAKKQDNGFAGSIDFEVSHRAGNVEITTMDVESHVDHLWNSMHSFIIVRNDYGWQGGKQYSSEGLIHLRHVFRTQSPFQPEIFLQSDYNNKRLLTYRALAGLGVRRVLYTHSKIELWAGTAFMPEHEEFDVDETNSQEKDVTVLRWSNYITTSAPIGENTHWTSTMYIQPEFGNFGDIRILANTKLSIKLFIKWSLDINFNLRYDSEPPDNIKSLDTELKPGFSIEF